MASNDVFCLNYHKRVSSTKSSPAGATAAVDADVIHKKRSYAMIRPKLENTSAHGIPHIVRETSPARRVIWSLLFVLALGAFIGLSGMLIAKYLCYSFNVNVDVIYEPALVFPAVTVCNMNPFRLSNVAKGSAELTEILGMNLDDPILALSSSTNAMYGDWENLEFSSPDARTEKLKSITQSVSNIPYEQRHDLGHDLGDMLLSCSFHGSPCSPSNFTWFFNYRYGNCYTFNSGVIATPLKSNEIGPIYGLSMELYIEQDEYISSLQSSAGIRLILHDQRVMPFPEDSGATLAPGRQTSIGITKVEVSQLISPYTNCTYEFPTPNIFHERFPYIIYSVPACEKSCLYRSIMKICNCASPRYTYNGSMETCDSIPSQESDCVKSVTEKYINREISCDCRSPCRKYFFKETISEAIWPNAAYRPTVLEAIRSLPGDLKHKVENNTEFIDTNVVKVIVYYSSLEYEHFYQTAKDNIYDLISALGGQLGLWIGVSVLTVFEFVELLYDCLRLCCCKLSRLGKRTVFVESMGNHRS